jgi:6-hydroxynicotinate reductase
MKIDIDKCTGCGICEDVCPLGVITVEDKRAEIGAGCVECNTCLKVCPQAAPIPETVEDQPKCVACPITCRIPEGSSGACGRYLNTGGRILRKDRVHSYAEVQDMVQTGDGSLIGPPLLTGIGSGTTYPDFIP